VSLLEDSHEVLEAHMTPLREKTHGRHALSTKMSPYGTPIMEVQEVEL
jgi:hypothetical protein